MITTTSGSPEELPVAEAALLNGNSGSVELEFELIVFPISLMYHQLTIPQSLDQPFLRPFLLIFKHQVLPDIIASSNFNLGKPLAMQVAATFVNSPA